MRPSQGEAPALNRGWLGGVVGPAVAEIPFYRDHLTGHDLGDVTGLPTFSKGDTVGYGQFPLSARGPVGAERVVATSGTSGDRMFFAFDRTDRDRVAAWLGDVGRRVGLRSDDVLLNTHCYGLWVGGHVLDLLAEQAGACVVPLGAGPAAGVLHMLAHGVGTVISATPSYVRRLIEEAHAQGIDLRDTALRLGFIGAEPAESALRANLSSRLPAGFRWIELYGLTETFGPSVAFAPDPGRAELELNTSDFHVEVLERGADVHVSSEAVGELTLTSRIPTRSPLIRYRTRDLVHVTSGSPEAPQRISRILGRADDAVKVGGVLMYPSAVADIVTGILPAEAEWRGTLIRRRDDHELLIEAEGPPELCEAIAVAFRERIGLHAPVVPASAALARSWEKTRRIVFGSDENPPPAPRPRHACG